MTVRLCRFEETVESCGKALEHQCLEGKRLGPRFLNRHEEALECFKGVLLKKYEGTIECYDTGINLEAGTPMFGREKLRPSAL